MRDVRKGSTTNQRTLSGVLCLIGLTVVAMSVAWYWPDRTLLHFWLVAQTMPVLYVVLAWWGSQAPQEVTDAL
jgi:hypothetical protein